MTNALRSAVFLAAVSASAQDPAVAIDHARAHIAAKQFSEALADLNGALDAAERLPSKERTQATAAVHFYTAVALTGTGAEADARVHLEKMLQLMPNAKLTGADRYDPRFVKLFNEVAGRATGSTFDSLYPGFDAVPPVTAPDASAWGGSPALDLLGSKAEKREWQSVTSRADRERFIEQFWRRRDPTRATTENEFREAFDRRVAFADKAFGSSDARGAATDRGRVFVLLGEPSMVRRRPITNADRVITLESEIVNGLIEQWMYTREQLPVSIGKKGVVFRFVTQKGIGDNVLQRDDVYAFQALAAATNPNEHR